MTQSSNGHPNLTRVGENAGNYEHIVQQLARREKLFEIINILSRRKLDLALGDDLVDVLKLTVELLGVTSGYLGDWDLESDSSTIIAEYMSDHANELERISDLGVTHNISEEFPTYKKWLTVREAYDIIHIDDPDIDPAELAHLLEYGAHSTLTVPLIPQTETLGYIEIWESRHRREFTQEDISLLQTIGRAIGKSMLNVKLFNALHESAEQNKLIMDASPEPIAVFNTHGKTTYINPTFVKTFGWEPDELFGKQIEFIPNDKAEELNDFLVRRRTDKSHISLDTQRLTKDGRLLDILISNALILDRDENIKGSISTFRDITRLRQTEAERETLLVAEQQQRLMAETLRDVTMALTAQTTQTGVLTEILTQVRRLVPYAAAQIVLIKGKDVQIVHTAGYSVETGRTLIADMVQPIATFPSDLRVINSKQPLIISNTHEEPGWVITEATAWIHSYLVAPIVLRDEVIGLVRMDGDSPNQFTERHGQHLMPLAGAAAIALENVRLLAEEQQRAQELAQARDKALEANRLKSTLLANVSHELRTPLGAVLGYAEMLNAGIYGDLTPDQADITGEIIESGTFLTHMVNNLLDQAQLESGHFLLDNTPFPVNDLFDPVKAQLQLLAFRKGLTLTFNMDSGVPTRLFGARERLQQIVINLVSNAIKFTNQGGISVRLIRSDKLFWGIQVADSGVGIPDEFQAKIFQPFAQLDNTATRTTGGSGLGLSIVKQLIELMGGKITLTSSQEFGTTFTVHFPLFPVEIT